MYLSGSKGMWNEMQKKKKKVSQENRQHTKIAARKKRKKGIGDRRMGIIDLQLQLSS